VNAELLQLLVANPQQVAPTSGQLTALRVLADQWIQRGGTKGLGLAERLQGPVSEARRVELGYEMWPPAPDPRQQALSLEPDLTPSVNELAARGDFEVAVQVLGSARGKKRMPCTRSSHRRCARCCRWSSGGS
jgi:hypothetical protein